MPTTTRPVQLTFQQECELQRLLDHIQFSYPPPDLNKPHNIDLIELAIRKALRQ